MHVTDDSDEPNSSDAIDKEQTNLHKQPFSYRPATHDDLAQIVRVQHDSQEQIEFANFTNMDKAKYLLPYADLYSIWIQRLIFEHNDPNLRFQTVVAIDNSNKRICGVISFQTINHHGYIRTLYVAPRYTGHRIGGQLLNIAVNYCLSESDVISVRLEVLHDNEWVVRFYQKFGFVEHSFIFPSIIGGSAKHIFGRHYKVLQLELLREQRK